MSPERKAVMISLRVPAALVARIDHAVRNPVATAATSRSAAVTEAIENWVALQEKELRRAIGEAKTR